MEKEKILEWLDKLIEGFDILYNNKFFDPERGYESPFVCGETIEKSIQLYCGLETIRDICGFKMGVEAFVSGEEGWKRTSFQYNGYEFYELTREG